MCRASRQWRDAQIFLFSIGTNGSTTHPPTYRWRIETSGPRPDSRRRAAQLPVYTFHDAQCTRFKHPLSSSTRSRRAPERGGNATHCSRRGCLPRRWSQGIRGAEVRRRHRLTNPVQTGITVARIPRDAAFPTRGHGLPRVAWYFTSSHRKSGSCARRRWRHVRADASPADSPSEPSRHESPAA